MIELILVAGLLFAVTFILFKIIKNAATVVILTVSLLVLTVIIGSALIYLDAKSLKENTAVSKTTIIVTSDDYKTAICGIRMNLDNTSKNTPLNEEEMTDIGHRLDKKEYNAILNTSYKLIIIPEKSLKNILDNITISQGSKISKEEFFRVIDSSTPIETYLEDLSNSIVGVTDEAMKEKVKNALRNNITVSDIEFKGKLLGIVFNSILMTNPEGIVLEYKRNRIIIYPETILLKILKIVPDEQIKQQFEKIKEKTKTSIADRINNETEKITNSTINVDEIVAAKDKMEQRIANATI